MGDLTFKPIGEVKVGDTVVGWEQRATKRFTHLPYDPTASKKRGRRIPLKRAMCIATVVGTARRIAPIIKVTMKSGKIIRCTPDHLWSSIWATDKGHCWVRAEKGRKLRRIVDVDIANPNLGKFDQHLCGYLGGIYDGEGSHRCISQYKYANPVVYAEIERVLNVLEIPYTPLKDGKGFQISGGRDHFVRFINLCKPAKRKKLVQMSLGFCNATPDEVVDIVDDGVGEVVSLQTTTGNYVAWGYASKNCILDLDGGGAGHIRFRESQELLLSRYLIPAEDQMESELAAGAPTDGLRFYWHKARQLYSTATAIMLIWHRMLFIEDSRALGAVAEDDKKTAYYERHRKLYDGLPWWMRPQLKFESKDEHIILDSVRSSIYYAAGNQKGGMGQGNQYELQHLTECAFWQMPEYHIDYILKDTLPQGPRTLAIRESTANGRGDWWHTNTEHARQRLTSWGYVFIPWYVVREKRRRRPPELWRPDAITLKHAERVLASSPEWTGRTVVLDREQLYWWESERKEAQRTHGLAMFYTNVPSDPAESFQHHQRAAFEAEQIERWRMGVTVPQMGMEVVTRG